MRIYELRLKMLCIEESGDFSVRTTRTIGIAPTTLTSRLRETYGNEDHKILKVKYKYRYVRALLSLKKLLHLYSLETRTQRASMIRAHNTTLSQKLPSAILTSPGEASHEPIGLEPMMRSQQVGIHRATDAVRFLTRSYRKKATIKKTIIKRASLGSILGLREIEGGFMLQGFNLDVQLTYDIPFQRIAVHNRVKILALGWPKH